MYIKQLNYKGKAKEGRLPIPVSLAMGVSQPFLMMIAKSRKEECVWPILLEYSGRQNTVILRYTNGVKIDVYMLPPERRGEYHQIYMVGLAFYPNREAKEKEIWMLDAEELIKLYRKKAWGYDPIPTISMMQ